MTLIDNMPHEVRHWRPSYTRDSLGGHAETLTTVANNVKSWVQNASRTEIERFQKRDELITHKVFFQADPGLQVGDRMYVTSGPAHVGEDLMFIADSDRSAGLGVLWGAVFRREDNPRPEYSLENQGCVALTDDDGTLLVDDDGALLIDDV